MQRENDVDELDHMKAKISLEKWKHSMQLKISVSSLRNRSQLAFLYPSRKCQKLILQFIAQKETRENLLTCSFTHELLTCSVSGWSSSHRMKKIQNIFSRLLQIFISIHNILTLIFTLFVCVSPPKKNLLLGGHRISKQS